MQNPKPEPDRRRYRKVYRLTARPVRREQIDIPKFARALWLLAEADAKRESKAKEGPGRQAPNI